MSLRLLLNVPNFLQEADFEYNKYGADKYGAGNIFVMFIHEAVVYQHHANKNADVVKNIKRYFFAHGLIYLYSRINFFGPGQYAALQVI